MTTKPSRTTHKPRAPKSPSKPAKKPKTSRASKSSPPKASAPASLDRHGIVVGADPRSIARARELTAGIARRKARIAEDFYEIGQALRELQDRELFRKVYGFTSFDDFLRERGIYAPSQARKLLTIVAGMPKSRALKLGVEKAAAALALAAATPEADSAETIFARGRKVQGKSPSDASADDFLKEARSIRAKERGKKQTDTVVTDAKRERLAKRKAGLAIVSNNLAVMGVPQSTLHKLEHGVSITLSWSQVEKIATKLSKHKR